jgi:hypothetical protein
VQARADWWTDDAAGIGAIAPERLVFLDESAVLTSMARRYGRSPRGQRAYAKVPFGNWKRLSVLSALGIEGFLATMSVEDATDAAIFAAYLEQVLLPVLREHKPDAVRVMDHLRPHKTPYVDGPPCQQPIEHPQRYAVTSGHALRHSALQRRFFCLSV